MGKKLLIISQRFWPEENDINTVASCFADNDVKVDVLCGQPQSPEGRFLEGYKFKGHKKESFGNINIYRAAEIKKHGTLQKRYILNYFSFALTSFFRIRELNNNQYDAVFIWQTSPVFQGWTGLRLAKRRGIKAFIYVEDLWPEAFYRQMDIKDAILRGLFRRISSGQYKKAYRLLTASEETQRYLVREIADTPGRVIYIPPFVSDKFLAQERIDKIRQRFLGSFNLLYIGQIPDDDSFDIFLDLAQMLTGAAIKDIRMIFAGEGDGFEDFKKKIDKRGLYDMIFPEGKVPQKLLPGYIEAADAFIFAQKLDTDISYKPPKEIINFCGAGKPVAAAADMAGREVIKKAGCGFACAPEDEKGFFENILKLYKTPKEELVQMGERGRLYALENFSAKESSQRIMEVIFPGEEAEP